MKYVDSYSHRHGREALIAKGLLSEVTACLNNPRISVVKKSTTPIKQEISRRLLQAGWAKNVAVDTSLDITVNHLKAGIGLTTQTGNISRAFYDLLKLEALHRLGRVDGAVLITPTNAASKKIGSNVANFERVVRELMLYRDIIVVPLLVISFG